MASTVLGVLKRTIRGVLPDRVIQFRLSQVRKRERALNASRTTKEIFEDIYAEGKWGGASIEEGSGSGSDERVASEYIGFVNGFLAANPEIRKVVDLGCGDFRVGRNFRLGSDQTYIGVDIVDAVVESNKRRFGDSKVSFLCLDATADVLPDADLYLVRQVLQHLSNAQAMSVLEKICATSIALVTEHHPAPSRFTGYNLDKPTGPDVRVYDGSGIYPDQPPFSFSGVKVVLQSTPGKCLVSEGELLVTYLIGGES